MLIPILVFAVLGIVLIVLLVKSAETWNWLQIALVAFIFLTSIFAGMLATRSLKTRQAWMDRNQKNIDKIAELEMAYSDTIFGSEDAIDYGEGSMRDLNFRQQMNQLGQGRIWFDGGVSLENEQYSVSFIPPEGKVSPLEQLKPDMILFAFGDQSFEVGDELSTFPADFMGSFRIASVDSDNNDVVLEPLFESKQLRVGSQMRALATALSGGDTAQMQAAAELAIELYGDEQTEFDTTWKAVSAGGAADGLVTWLNDKASSRQPQGNWSLFEKMPGDDHEAFRKHMEIERWEEATPEMLAEYRQALQVNYLPATMMNLDPEGEEYEKLLDEFTFDGVKINVIQQYVSQNVASRINDSFDPPVANIWGLVEFDSRSEAFRVNGEGNVRTDGKFDFNGGANDPALKHTEDEITFGKGDQILVPKEWGNDGFEFGRANDRQPPLIETSDNARWLNIEYYIRSTRDYPFRLSRYLDLTRRSIEQERIVQKDIAVTVQMQNDTQDQIDHRTDHRTKLTADIERMKSDLDVISKLREQREAELQDKQEKVRIRYNQIIETYKQAQAASSGEFLDTRVRRPSKDELAKQSR